MSRSSRCTDSFCRRRDSGVLYPLPEKMLGVDGEVFMD
jgi:hypothetical protein